MLDRLVRLPEVVALVGRSESSIRRDVAAGRFPGWLRTGPRSIAWKVSDLEAWVSELQRADETGSSPQTER